MEYLSGAVEFLDLVADQSDSGLEVIAGGQELHTSGNWKLLIENSYDAYHGPTLHRSYFEFLDDRVSGRNMVATQRGYGLGLGNGHGVFEIELNSGRPVAQWIPPFGEEAKPKIEALKDGSSSAWGMLAPSASPSTSATSSFSPIWWSTTTSGCRCARCIRWVRTS